MSLINLLNGYLFSKQIISNDLSLGWVLVSNGGTYEHDSVILFGILAEKTSSPEFVAKVTRLPLHSWILEIEYNSLSILWNCMGESFSEKHFPKPLGLLSYENQRALLISYLHGESMLKTSGASLWMDIENLSPFTLEIAEFLNRIFCSTITSTSYENYPSFEFSKRVEQFRMMYPLTDTHKRNIENILNKLNENLSNGNERVLLHGDFWHGNLIHEKKSKNLMVVDWQYARWSSDVSLDVYLFLLAGALAISHGSSLEEISQSLINVLHLWKDKIIPEYLRIFRCSKVYSLLPIKEGMLFCCIEKATRSKMDFGISQHDDMLWWHIFNEIIDMDIE